MVISPAAKGVVQPLALLDGRLALDDWNIEAPAELVELVEVLADDERWFATVLGHELLNDAGLLGGRRAESVSLVRFCSGVRQPLALWKGDAHLDALGRRDVALRLDLFPRSVVALGADQREDVTFATVFSHQRRRQAEAATRLDVGGEPKIGAGSRCTSS